MVSKTEQGLLLVALAILAAYLVVPAGSGRVAMGHIVLTAAPAGSAFLAFRAARRGGRGTTATWLLLAVGALGVAFAQLLWAFRQLVLEQPPPFPSISYYLFLAFHPLLAAALIVSLRDGDRVESRAEITHDAVLACVAIVLVLLRFVFEPLRATRPWLTTGELGWMVTGQFLAQVPLVAATVLIVWRRTALPPRAAAALVGVAFVNSVATLLLIAGLDPDPGSPGNLFDLVWLSGWFVLAGAAAAGATASGSAWTGPRAVWLSMRLRQSIAPAVMMVMTVIVVHVAVVGGASLTTTAVLSAAGGLLVLRLAGTLGAADREHRKQQELARTRVLVRLSRTLATAPSLAEALAHVGDAGMKLLGGERAWVERIESSDVVRVASAQPTPAGVVLPAERSWGWWLAGRRTAQVLTGPDLYPFGPDGLPVPVRVWLACAAVRFGDTMAGTLVLERADRGFDSAELDLLGALADQVAVAVENARLVDEARDAERLRLHTDKLASLGKLAAGVAHEINNPLAAIHSAAAMLEVDDPDDVGADAVEIIRTETARAARIVRRMLDFVRPAEVRLEPVELKAVVDEVVLSRLADHQRRGIRTHVDLDGLPRVVADRSGLVQVFLNLVMNAEHALEGTTGERMLRLHGRCEGPDVQVHVYDSGVGIAPADIGRVFDPFFTTKPVGEGTGLGLSVSYGVVREMAGSITVESAPGRGTTFTVLLPSAGVDVGPQTVDRSLPEPRSTESFSVLLVEDEASLRLLVPRFLRRRGHVVEVAENGRVALDILCTRQFDVVVTDLKMPVMDGESLYAHLCRTAPATAGRVLFMSGDTVADDTREFLARTARPFISKPFDLDELAKRVAEIGGSVTGVSG